MKKPHLPEPQKKKPWLSFHKEVKTKVERKLKAQKSKHNIWLSFGMFGMVGWSVAIPTLVGIALGVWIDQHIPSRYSWTLMLLVIGLALGCFNAWYWLQKESR
jgi:ATP synthase protein I